MSVQAKWHGAHAVDMARRAAADGLLLSAEELLTRSRRLVPHETGDLERDSIASLDEGGMVAAVTFGVGLGAAYAVPQHEEMSWRHDSGRQAKYLEEPLNAADFARARDQIMQRELKKAL
jgi:hypothetical protein